jgi:hypothetical protein
MKNSFLVFSSGILRALVAGFFTLACGQALATVFSTNTYIGSANTNYEGIAVVVSNCTLTVDGSHTFSSLQVTTGGVLTHSPAPAGYVTNLYYLTNEAQVLYGSTPATLLNSNVISSTVYVTDYTKDIVYTNGQDYTLSSPDGVVTQIARTANSSIPDGGIILVSYEGYGPGATTVAGGLNLTITSNVEVDAGGAINANGAGSSAGSGVGRSTGSPANGGGGAFGGNGGLSATDVFTSIPYGSYTQPANLGSGGGTGAGGPGGPGGGLIQITSGGNVIINGLISANGANGTNDRSGGGSGGGIFISGQTLSGSGLVTANGGAGEPVNGGGGGGGRISILYTSTTFTGAMTAYGGAGFNAGGAGTVYTKLTGQNALLVLNNGGQSSAVGTYLTVQSSTVNVLIQSNATAVAFAPWTIANLTIAANSFLVATQSSTLNITVTGILTVETSGAILANGTGSGPGTGSGAGRANTSLPNVPCGGGGYGGYGANGLSSININGESYGSQNQPSSLGSGGGNGSTSIGGYGGGAIIISCSGGVVQVDGVISANGGNGSGTGGGGGSGGTVTIYGGTLIGTGSISANGGSGANSVGGGGGGGRIGINPTANFFAGTITAYGGGGAAWGGAGTIYLAVVGQINQLIVDNGGNLGTNTPLSASTSTDLIVRNGAIGSASSSVNFANLYVNSNGWLAAYSLENNQPANAVNFSFSGNATIQPGGGIIADSGGYPGSQGSGAGKVTSSGATNFCGGGGHGGVGGASAGNLAIGGLTYDSLLGPLVAGSGGGSASPLAPGGFGGGVVRLSVTGTLEVDGLISANGGNGSGLAGGGGAGGSIWLTAGNFIGSGSITANGGSGADGISGGGGGGMILVSCSNNGYGGTMTAYGGGGANVGGPGTVVTQLTGKNYQLVLDAGGLPGVPTPLPNNGTVDVTFRNGAVASAIGTSTIGNLLISSNSSLLVSNLFGLTCASLTVQQGGAILSDASGYPAGGGEGPGHGSTQPPYYPCGGGGNDGPGGNSIANLALGGVNELYYYEPNAGGGGGSQAPYSLGGAGGGLMSITTTGLMQIDGIISANGANGTGLGGGGGAGGGISLTCASLGGAGIIRANGGSGVGNIGGGGGGGAVFIVVNSAANEFVGTITAYGGGGANWGGSGVVSTQTSGQGIQLVLDNGGNSGAPTPLPTQSAASFILRNGAIALATSGFNFNSGLISSNASLLISNSFSLGLGFSNLNVQAGGSIIADSAGSAAGLGTGAGHNSGISPNYPCGGAGHGGAGGNSLGNAAIGGSAYDNAASPVNVGSGGGNFSPYSLGGGGGGAFSLTVTGLLQVDGIISANGGNGSGIGGGGGSGGTVKLTVGTLSGGGVIRANGGIGANSIGGGGAGGCIAISPTLNEFSGTITAGGGGGANWGGAGTLYIQTNGQPAQLILDNAGQFGAATPIGSVSSSTALVLRNGAIAYPQSSQMTLASLLIASNGWLTGSNTTGLIGLTITGNATIEPGGGIIADNSGFTTGPGAGQPHAVFPYYPCSGGGYGGSGGNASSNVVAGGAVYSSVVSPVSNGSGGGTYSPYSIGGAGGGAINLVVEGTLDASGRISANGGNGSGIGGGGGSGGSILLNVGTLTGDGSITASGGNGADSIGGGGGGGRIAIVYNTDTFSGATAAHGGGGYAYGGAGTVYTKANNSSIGQVLVENGGANGATTPLSTSVGTPSSHFNLTISNGAIATPQKGLIFPLLNNLTIASGGELTALNPLSTLDVIVFNDADINPGGAIIVDTNGYAQTAGPGAGNSSGGDGSGAGYGGTGGASTTTGGGGSYGSAVQPVDFGSGGGLGTGTILGGSGGGALRLNVGGILTVDGKMSAEGQPGLQDNSGGGSGGSIWVTAGTFTGAGLIAADGGAGQLNGGGGGAGGRIALYSRANAFFGGTSANGASGAFAGGNGTIVISNSLPPLQVLSNTPSGTVSNAVSSVIVYFNDAPNPSTVSANSFVLTAPNGPVPTASLSVTMLTSSSYQISFPAQTAIGTYSLSVVATVFDLYGRVLSPAYTGTFNVSLPAVQGTITDGSGNPLPGVLLQPSVGSTTTTDTNGNYALGFVPGSSFTVTPSLGALMFVPPSMSYTNATNTITGQNYTGVTNLTPAVSATASAGNFVLGWWAVPGLNYQVYCSSNLTTWLPCGPLYAGSNGPVQMSMPMSGSPMQFFSVQPSY